MPLTIIAEAGVNHDGKLHQALALVDAGAKAGADVVKFQTFRAESLATERAGKAAYQQVNTGTKGSQLDMLRGLELSPADHRQLMTRCAERHIRFLSTPFDAQSLAFLVDDLGLDTIKFSSGDLTNGPLLLDAARRGVKLILSTGMATMDETAEALGVVAFGYLGGGKPSRQAFAEALADPASRPLLASRVVVLQCTTEYPADPADVNLRVMDRLAERFGVPVGLSDHTPGIAVALGAVGRGAVMIEKHLTLDKSLPGPDHKASLEPGELADLVTGARMVAQALGNGEKAPVTAEIGNRAVARKSLVAACPIAAGESFTAANLAIKRPGDGVSPMDWWERQGQAARRAYQPGEAIDP